MTAVGACVYRAFDQHERLLYVGMTSRPSSRFAQHQSQTDWWSEVASLTLEHHATIAEAAAAEHAAILGEAPEYNLVDGQRRPLKTPAAKRRRVASRHRRAVQRNQRRDELSRKGRFDLEYARLNAGLSARQLAELVGVSGNAILSIEAGRHIPHVGTAKKVADYFRENGHPDIKVADLLPPLEEAA